MSADNDFDFDKLPDDIKSKYLVRQKKRVTVKLKENPPYISYKHVDKIVWSIKKNYYCNCCGVIFGEALIAVYGSSIANTQRSEKKPGRCVPCETVEAKIKKTCILCGEHKGDMSLEWFQKNGQLCGKCIFNH